MKRKRRNHSSVFNAKVALEALKNDRSLTELSAQFDVHANQIQDLRKRLLHNSDTVFGRRQQQEAAAGKVKDLHAKIGQLTMERDFLEQGLERIHGPSGKK